MIGFLDIYPPLFREGIALAPSGYKNQVYRGDRKTATCYTKGHTQTTSKFGFGRARKLSKFVDYK
jgi:hypothetical protein